MSDIKLKKLSALKDFSKATDEEAMEAFKSPFEIAKRFESENELMRKGEKLYPEFRNEKGQLFDTPMIDKRTKLLEAAKADNISAENELKSRGYKKYGEKRFKHPVTGKLLKSLAVISALGMSDMASAAVDFVVPGGVEEMGVSDEQKLLDRQYKERIKQRQEKLNSLGQ